jgi:hypothetical protein
MTNFLFSSLFTVIRVDDRIFHHYYYILEQEFIDSD